MDTSKGGELRIFITGPDGQVKAQASGGNRATLVYNAPYEEGDVIHMAGGPGFVAAQLEDSMAEAYGYLSGEFCLAVPFGEKKISYSPKSFTGDRHLLWVRRAEEEEVRARRNLARNVLDSHDNQGLFPHASANVETRGESAFAARNAIDGCYANHSHGRWPFQSWGINRDPNAAFRLDFGRSVRLDRVVFTLRADFPHDSWWNRCTVRFSDGSRWSRIISSPKVAILAIAPCLLYNFHRFFTQLGNLAPLLIVNQVGGGPYRTLRKRQSRGRRGILSGFSGRCRRWA